MTAARERIETVLHQLRQRQEKEQQAAAAWQRARARCLQLVQALLEGTDAVVKLDDDRLILTARHGARAQFVFERRQLALIGTKDKGPGSGETFFSLRIEPPARQQSVADGTWGPGRAEGLRDLSPQAGSKEAFEKAVADWFEWAYVGTGAPSASA
jgi:hypothetical protein